MNNLKDRQFFILDDIVNLSLDIRLDKLQNTTLYRDIGIKNWLKDYSTIKFSMSRGSGHSTNLIRVLDKNFENPLIIYKNESIALKNHIISMDGDFKYTIPDKIKYTTYTAFERHIRGIEFDCIAVDTAFAFSKEKIELLYDLGTPYNPLFTLMFIQ